MRWLIAVFMLVLATASLAACGSSTGDDAGRRSGPTVVVTTTQLGDIARAVASDRAAVEQILKPGTDPHAYEPRPSDLRAIGDAKLVVRSGGDIDAWLADVLRGAGSSTTTITILDTLRPRREDPHWWQNPRTAVIAAQRIRDALIAADPPGRDAYAAGADSYVSRLLKLDAAIAGCMRRVPRADRKLVTDHDAFGAYADRYDIEVIGTVIPALSTQAQASGGEVARLVRTIRSAGVSTIFPESSVNQQLTKAIARDAGASVGAALYSDSLGRAGTPGSTYLGSLRANTSALVKGFSDGAVDCELPG